MAKVLIFPAWRASIEAEVQLQHGRGLSLINPGISPSSLRFSCHGLTHTGLVREHNEDNFACMPDQQLWVVADGMGGHSSGDFASLTLVEEARQFTRQNSLDHSILLLEETFLAAHQKILDEASRRPGQTTIGSTLVSLFAWNNLAFILWAGDSRAYVLRNERLIRLTEDHSLVEELVRMGQLDADRAEAHPAANVVLNAVGVEETLYLDLEYSTIHDRDLFLLCSDGLYKDLDDDTIRSILSSHSDNLEQASISLLEAALDAGGSDNCTVVLVKAEQ